MPDLRLPAVMRLWMWMSMQLIEFQIWQSKHLHMGSLKYQQSDDRKSELGS